jgi:hypothetical protein
MKSSGRARLLEVAEKLKFEEAREGHDFSRAVKPFRTARALAPEGLALDSTTIAH